jgi:hypothetical protein
MFSFSSTTVWESDTYFTHAVVKSFYTVLQKFQFLLKTDMADNLKRFEHC